MVLQRQIFLNLMVKILFFKTIIIVQVGFLHLEQFKTNNLLIRGILIIAIYMLC